MCNLSVLFFRRLIAVMIVVACLVGAVGCSSGSVSNQVAALNDSNIKQLANLYYAYQRAHGFQGPKDEDALKQFVKNDMDPKKLQMMKVDATKLDTLFISDRDQRPFVVKYSTGGGLGANVPVVFEKTGVNGKRQVGFTGSIVEEVDDAKYNELWEGHRPANADPQTSSPSKIFPK